MAREPLVQDRVPLNAVKYAGRDFGSIFDALLRRQKIAFADLYNDFAETPQAIMLDDLCAFAASQLCWALDRTASDCFLSTVRTPMPAGWLTRGLSYKMYAAAAAAADLTLTFADGIPGPCTMTAGWRFQGPESIQYELIADRVFGVQAPGYTTSVAVRQGNTRKLSYVGNNAKFQQYNLEYAGENEYIADGGVRVWVDGAEWTEQEFLTYEATNQFEVDYQAVPPHVRFGDGYAGNVPATGADIRIEFLKIVGVKGNVKAHTITTSLDVLSVAGVPVVFTLDNPLPARSGRDAETVDHARRTAPYAFASRGGAITLTDYQAQANGFVDPLNGAVAKAYAFTPRAAYDDIVFNDYADEIQAYVDTFMLAVSGALTTLAADQADISTLILAIEADRAAIEALRTTMLGVLTSAQAGLVSARSTLLMNEGNFAALASADTEALNDINAMQAYLDAHITGADHTALTALLASITADVNTMKAAADAALSGDGAARATVEGAEVQVSAANDTVLGGGAMDMALQDQATQIAGLAAPLVDITVQVNTMDAAATALDAGVGPDLTAMQARVGELFDASCRANLVQVPILSVDADGEYIAPPSGLMASLQVYLDTKKEVTQYVEVIDGSTGLVPVDILVSVKVGAAYTVAEVISAIDATVRGIMRGRDYAQPLYLSDLYRYIRECSDGIEYATVQIVGSVGGNLIPAATEILVMGTLTITEVP
jgi:hypothetical protein